MQLEQAIANYVDPFAFGTTDTTSARGRMRACMAIAASSDDLTLASAALREAQQILANAIPDDARPFKVRLADPSCRKLVEEFSLGQSALRRRDFKASRHTEDTDD